jgi:hypothetical protein
MELKNETNNNDLPKYDDIYFDNKNNQYLIYDINKLKCIKYTKDELINIFIDKMFNIFNILNDNVLMDMINTLSNNNNKFYLLKFGNLCKAYAKYYNINELKDMCIKYLYTDSKEYFNDDIHLYRIIPTYHNIFIYHLSDYKELYNILYYINEHKNELYNDIIKILYEKIYTNEMYLKYFKNMKIHKDNNDNFYVDFTKITII